MRAIGVREFRDQATTLLAAGETLVIERHGEPVGFFVPIVARDRSHSSLALGRLADAVANLAKAAGIDEEDLVEELTPVSPSR